MPPGDIWQSVETLWVVTTGEMAWVVSGQWPRMLLNILSCTGETSSSPPTQRIIRSKMSIVLQQRNPGVKMPSSKLAPEKPR